MNKLILEDELSIIVGSYSKFTKKHMKQPKFAAIRRKKKFLYDKVIVVTDSNPLGKFLFPVYETIQSKGNITIEGGYSVGGDFPKFDNFEYGEYEFSTPEKLKELAPVDRCAIMICIDCENVKSRDAWLEALQTITDYAAKGKENMCIVSLLIPEYPPIPDSNIQSLSEREFSYFMEEVLTEHTESQKFFIDIESKCREIVGNGFENINIIRVDNLYGPDSNMIRTFDIKDFILKSFEKGVVEINSSDYENKISCLYIRDVVHFILRNPYKGRKGQIYNFCSRITSIAAIKHSIRSNFPEKLGISVNAGILENNYYRCLNTLKFFQCGWKKKNHVGLATGVYRTVCDIIDERDNNKKNIAIYSGKLTRIKELELMMLKDIDELCEKNGIKYFLCGGTMLGAVRYGHSIPWDDDLDIGMLRKDFDKFRKVCQEQQKPIYNYSSHINGSGSHYIVDKVRLNGTYFSTKYSSIHEYPDGLFIDVLVYDQTSNIHFIAKMHSKIVHYLSKMIEVRWYNRPRKKNRKKEKRILPFLRLFPIGFYHALFEFFISLYKNKKNAKYVIDSTGKLQKKGPFLMEGLEDVTRVDFDGGFKAPIPVDTTNYLTFDYGPNYLPEPTLSKRAAPHNFARIDLGQYIFSTNPDEKWREVNVRGELFEK